MSGKPAEPPPGPPTEPPTEPPRSPAPPASAAANRAGGSSEGAEHIGPLAIARHVKDDGRALILYTSTAEPRARTDGDAR